MKPDLDLVFSALADPTRRKIVARLARGEATVMDLAAPFQLAQPTVSKHIKVLERAGLVSRSRVAQTRPCRLEPVVLRAAMEWVGSYRRLWEDSFDRLDEFLDAGSQTQRRSKK